MRPSSLLAELYGADLPCVFQLQGLANPGLTVRPPGASRQSRGNDDLLPSGSAATDALQAFNFDEYCRTGSSVPAAGKSAPPGTRSVTVTLTVPHTSPVEMTPSESIASPSPLSSFYAAIPSPVSATDPSPPPSQPMYVPPRGAAGRRVRGSWKVPLVVLQLASPIPSCTASPKQAAV
jgi:hypothetical protein